MISAFWRRKVDLPPMFGPVTSHSRDSSDKAAVVGDEARAAGLQRLLDHRMAAALDLEAGMVASKRGRHQPPSAARSASAAATSSRASASAAAAIGSARAQRGRDQLLEMGGLGGERMGAGLADPQRLLVQVGRVEADHAGQRLAVGEARIRRPSACRHSCAGTSIWKPSTLLWRIFSVAMPVWLL